MLEAIGAGSSKRMGGGDWHEKWKASEEFAIVKREIAELKQEALAKPDDTDPESAKEYATPFAFQLKTIVYVSSYQRASCDRVLSSTATRASSELTCSSFIHSLLQQAHDGGLLPHGRCEEPLLDSLCRVSG
jgi:hypothetical protein